jgi:hypothetical protein
MSFLEPQVSQHYPAEVRLSWRRMSLYLSGPITGIAQLNKPAFDELREVLLPLFKNVLVPHDFFEGVDTEGWTWQQYMRTCIRELATADAIFMMQGWPDSKGACLELEVARGIGLEVFYQSRFFQ